RRGRIPVDDLHHHVALARALEGLVPEAEQLLRAVPCAAGQGTDQCDGEHPSTEATRPGTPRGPPSAPTARRIVGRFVTEQSTDGMVVVGILVLVVVLVVLVRVAFFLAVWEIGALVIAIVGLQAGVVTCFFLVTHGWVPAHVRTVERNVLILPNMVVLR